MDSFAKLHGYPEKLGPNYNNLTAQLNYIYSLNEKTACYPQISEEYQTYSDKVLDEIFTSIVQPDFVNDSLKDFKLISKYQSTCIVRL